MKFYNTINHNKSKKITMKRLNTLNQALIFQMELNMQKANTLKETQTNAHKYNIIILKNSKQEDILSEKPDEGFSDEPKNYLKINSEHKNGPLGHLGRVPGAYPENDPQNDDVVHRDH